MLYWIVFLIILICCFLDIESNKPSKRQFFVVYTILILMSTLRKGQGSDYYNYLEVYNIAVETGELSILLLFLKPDFLFYFICYFLGSNGVDFMWFSAIISAITLILLTPFFTKICNYSLVSLLLFYSYFFNSYFCSIMREGLSLALILGIGLPNLINGKKIWYFLTVIISASIHASSLICLFFPLLTSIRISNYKWILLIISFTLYSFISQYLIQYFPSFIKLRMLPYIEDKPFIVSYISRLLLIMPLFFIKTRTYEHKPILRMLRNLTVSGYLIYCLLSFGFIIASRTSVYYTILICAVMPYVVNYAKSLVQRKIILMYISIICMILLGKDINGYISQGNYRNCNFLTYPYLSVFDDNATIHYYRQHLGFADKSN